MMTRARLVPILVLLLAVGGVAGSAGPPFELGVRRDRLVGGARGTLVIDREGIAFRTPDRNESRRWDYPALKQVRILSPTRITLDTYEDQGRLHFGSDRSYTFEVTGAISGELVAFLLARIDRPIVTAVMPPLPAMPLFRVLVKGDHGGRGREGALQLYDSGIAYLTEDQDDARFWRFRDVFGVLMLDPYRLQVLAYEGGSGETRVFTFELREALPPGMYDALWQHVNGPRRPRLQGQQSASPREEDRHE